MRDTPVGYSVSMNTAQRIRITLAVVGLGAFLALCTFLGGLKTDAYHHSLPSAYTVGATWAVATHADLAECERSGLNDGWRSPGLWLKGCFDHATNATHWHPST